MLRNIGIILMTVLWTLFCVGILLYLNLDSLRTRVHRVWKQNRAGLADWYGISYPTKRPDEQVQTLLEARRQCELPDPEWWHEFTAYYNTSAERYRIRMETPVFRQIGRLLRFREMPIL